MDTIERLTLPKSLFGWLKKRSKKDKDVKVQPAKQKQKRELRGHLPLRANSASNQDQMVQQNSLATHMMLYAAIDNEPSKACHSHSSASDSGSSYSSSSSDSGSSSSSSSSSCE